MTEIPINEAEGTNCDLELIELPESVINDLKQHADNTREQILILLEHFMGEDSDMSQAAHDTAVYLQQQKINTSVANILAIADIPEDAWIPSPVNLPPVPELPLSSKEGSIPARVSREQYYSQKPIVNDSKVGRNDPCPCGSGKKYKKCHGAAK